MAQLCGLSEPVNALPKDNHELAMRKMLNTIGEKSAYLKKKKELKWMPCFVIDGVDLLAKKDPAAFTAPVDRA